jgi:hypothetical protein
LYRKFKCTGPALAAAALAAASAPAQMPIPPAAPGAHPAAPPSAGASTTVPGGGEHQHLDSRFGHNHYYYDRGYAVHSPPDGSLTNLHGPDGQRYDLHAGDWYRWNGGLDQSWHWQRWWHGPWLVSAAPTGLFVPYLPPHYTTIWWSGTPYYYANSTYYRWDAGRNEYQVIAPPAGLDAAGTTPSPVTTGASDQLFADPTKGQTSAQQSQDRDECHQWASAETGYSPTAADAATQATQARDKRDAYFHAQVACLQAKGYAVK